MPDLSNLAALLSGQGNPAALMGQARGMPVPQQTMPQQPGLLPQGRISPLAQLLAQRGMGAGGGGMPGQAQMGVNPMMGVRPGMGLLPGQSIPPRMG